jgi:dolichol-phosphate mannosyltransferase
VSGQGTPPTYSFVVPVLDEADGLRALAERVAGVMAALDGPSELVVVDDGSTDGSWQVIGALAAEDPRVRGVRLSRNFGHQIAVSAGLDAARGDAVVILDADLQDPPELVPEMAARWREGFDVVYAVRNERQGETLFKRATAALFYRFLRRMTETDIPANVGDFRLADRRVVDAIRTMPERSRFLRGMWSWAGFRQAGVAYDRDPRLTGETKYPVRKMVKFAADGVINFSNRPLRMALNLGFFVSGVALLGGVGAVVAKASGAFSVPGWASLVVGISFLGGIQLMVLGVMGEYVGRIYDEVKRRPLYLVAEHTGARAPAPAADPHVVETTP